MLMTLLQKRGTFVGPRGPLLSNLTQLTLSKLAHAVHDAEQEADKVVGLSLGLFLPPAIAYFPQRASTSPEKLEPRFQDVKGPVYFNKGL
jgi:hypothetical protein